MFIELNVMNYIIKNYFYAKRNTKIYAKVIFFFYYIKNISINFYVVFIVYSVIKKKITF